MRKFEPVYVDFNEDSAYEHINPNVVFSVLISEVDDEEGITTVEVVNTDNNTREFQFATVEDAQRFIRRVGGV